ncbi:MAG: hypothetical protein RMM28_09325 [Thermoleophilia bacterium]|nr:hypothetical protein [Gaiellaceae bacterium]MDW8339326.1 hypothetical protein [Thermoleophilia bacterium]
MDDLALERVAQRLADVRAARLDAARLDAALERSRGQLESLAAAAADLEAALPAQVGAAVREGLRAEVLPVGRHVAEIRGLVNHAIRRLERIESELLAERRARVEDLALLVDLVSAGWRAVDRRLERLEGAQILAGAEPRPEQRRESTTPPRDTESPHLEHAAAA